MRQLIAMPHAAAIAEPPAPATPRLRLPRLCVALQAKTPAELFERAKVSLRDCRFFEFRLDLLPKPAAVLPKLKDFLHHHRDVIVIATCRRKPNGGAFTGSLAAQLAFLEDCAKAGCQILDLEIESAEQARASQLVKLRSLGAALLISFHDFARTRSLAHAADRIHVFHPDYVKIVSTARSLADNLAVLRLIEDRSLTTNIVGIAMGEEGILSRVLGPRAGSLFTFAAYDDGEETAPGQPSIRTLIDVYRIDQIDQATRIFGVAGNPVAHSLSPLMHNTAFRRENLNAVLLPLKPRNLDDLLTIINDLPLAGCAVTMPLKQEVLPRLANMDPLTARIGACNTLRTGADGKLYGFNTDVAGVIRPLEKRLRIPGARVAVLGAGGAARAAVFGLVEQGAEVYVVNRTHEHAVTLARQAHARSLKHEAFAKQRFDVLINATPCGMKGQKPALPIAEKELNAGLVFDMVYNPIETPLLQIARKRGIPVISGLEMFVQQGARQFEIWTGKPAPENEMLRVVEHELRRRG
ncbi:MAG TPA: shikimate dehydrogenase [Terracidiphilus sp.]|nr:shikimate dehydrogenase [Terracidiphilus sp.]